MWNVPLDVWHSLDFANDVLTQSFPQQIKQGTNMKNKLLLLLFLLMPSLCFGTSTYFRVSINTKDSTCSFNVTTSLKKRIGKPYTLGIEFVTNGTKIFASKNKDMTKAQMLCLIDHFPSVEDDIRTFYEKGNWEFAEICARIMKWAIFSDYQITKQEMDANRSDVVDFELFIYKPDK